ncbi:MAG TPA: amino acid permease [Candidatus Dormibacteraeota bacterium]|nr:amino acid permease [Candidatus Dormibacteraeota bacterium]
MPPEPTTPHSQPPTNEEGLHHQLSAGQMAMVAVGGSIGTGLLLGSGAAMEIAGPAAILSFIAAAFINWTVAMALGELACAHPAAGSFGVYGDLYLNSYAGFIARAGYWVGLALAIGTEMIAAATYMSSWFPSVRSYIWIVVFGAALLVINLRSVGAYARFEFWFSMIKLATIVAFIVIGASLLLGGRVVPQYNAHGGFFPRGFWAPVVALTYAVYSFGGVEMVAVTTGESRSTKETPRAVWITFLTLSFVYVGAMVILLGVMPWNHAGVAESPFVTTFQTVKIPHASGIMNFVVLTAALSGANATLYVASRMIFSLARTGWAPASLGRLNHEGSPQNAVLHSSFGILFALVLALWAPENAFRYMLGAAFTGMILSWLVSLLAHINFRRRRQPEDIAALPLRSPFGMCGSIFGFIAVSISLLQTWLHPLVNLWSGLTCLAVLTIAYLILRSSRTERSNRV